jgi:hypothetical protein
MRMSPKEPRTPNACNTQIMTTMTTTVSIAQGASSALPIAHAAGSTFSSEGGDLVERRRQSHRAPHPAAPSDGPPAANELERDDNDGDHQQ